MSKDVAVSFGTFLPNQGVGLPAGEVNKVIAIREVSSLVQTKGAQFILILHPQRPPSPHLISRGQASTVLLRLWGDGEGRIERREGRTRFASFNAGIRFSFFSRALLAGSAVRSKSDSVYNEAAPPA